MHSLSPVFFESPMIVFLLVVSVCEWKNSLLFDTDTEEILWKKFKFSVYEIQSVSNIRYYWAFSGHTKELCILLPDYKIKIPYDRQLYNMKYFRMFLEAHDITIQEEERTWH